MAERHAAQLAELAELGMGLARDLRALAGAAQDEASAERLALAFHRVSRSVRQTLALESRLMRDRYALAEAARAEARRRTGERTNAVRAATNRLIWTETEGLEDEDGVNAAAEALLAGLEVLLDDAAAEPDFLETPVEALVAKIRAGLALAANDAGVAIAADAPAERPAAPGSG